MKKKITLKYKTPLEFVATYTREEFFRGGYDSERKWLEEDAGMPILNIIAKISGKDYFDLLVAFDRFAPKVGFLYCGEHDIFHEYTNCPFCQLDIRVD